MARIPAPFIARLKAPLAAIMCLLLAMPFAFAQESAPSDDKAPKSSRHQSGQLRGDERILHALNRFTFGPRPGDLEAVQSEGLENWFNQQLRPDTLDNSILQTRLAQFPAMQWSTHDLFYRLPNNTVIRQVIDGKAPTPPNGALHSIYTNEISRYENRQQQREQQKLLQASLSANAHPDLAQTSMMSAAQLPAEQPAPNEPQIAAILGMPPAQRVARLAALPQPEFDSLRKALKGPQRVSLITGLSPAQKEFLIALESPQRVVNDELVGERLTRDIYSNAQLQEVMTDFWLNHFNVYLHKNDETPYYLVSYERDVIRPRALGKFEDLLEATAHSPAMLLYLDNASSIGPDSPVADHARQAAARRPAAKKLAPEGLNENYARELMELHTLGVNGGYAQADITQVARVLSGWTIDHPARGGDFKFDESRHDPGTKKVLGKKIKEHGEQEGRELLHLLATRPATAKFISRKLAIRFVGDDPPQSLVNRMAKSYLSSDGDISAVLKTLFHSKELWSPETYRAKIKTPIEFVASAARASNASADNLQPLVNALRDMGMPLYGAVPPTGYKWDASDWVSTGALVNRMNFALALAANKLPGIAIAWSPQTGTSQTGPASMTPASEEQRLESLLVAGGVSASTRAAVLTQFNAQIQPPIAPAQIRGVTMHAAAKRLSPAQAANALEIQDQVLAGLLLGSPEFQRR